MPTPPASPSAHPCALRRRVLSPLTGLECGRLLEKTAGRRERWGVMLLFGKALPGEELTPGTQPAARSSQQCTCFQAMREWIVSVRAGEAERLLRKWEFWGSLGGGEK